MNEYTNETLTRLMQEVKEQNKEQHADIKDRVDATNGRVRKLEKWQWALAGALAALAMSIGTVGIDKILQLL